MRKIMNCWLLGLLGLSLLIMSASCKKVNPGELTTELLPLEGNPLIHLKILFKVGSANDPAGKEGLAQLAFNMLANGGTKTMTFKEISEKFYPMAASVSLSVDKEMSVFSGTIHRDNLDKFYAIFKEMILNPGFREEDFKRLRTNQLNFLEKTLISNMD